ncbi:MAG: hypothetical protein D6737_00450 [Chloroflexi bacterium]|nr:MAG: hypothetical protein D6737_00450 [Chloroflexota bacterium]
MEKKYLRGLFISFVLLSGIVFIVSTRLTDTAKGQDTENGIHLRGTMAQQIGEYPDTMALDGVGVKNLDDGFFELHLDPENDTGLMFSRFSVDQYRLDADTVLNDAEITIIFPLFGSPVPEALADYWQGGIAEDIFLHGDTGQEAPIIPKVWSEVATWGPALVFIDGQQITGVEQILGVPNRFDALFGHVMYSSNPRDAQTGFVPNASGDAPFSPARPADYQPVVQEASVINMLVRSEEIDDNAFPAFSLLLHFDFLDVVPIEPLPDVEYLTYDMLETVDVESAVTQWLSLVDDTAALVAEIESPDEPDAVASNDSAAGTTVSFAEDIQPIFQTRCVFCHGPESIVGSPPNGLQLDTYENVILGSSFLPDVIPGDPDNSTLMIMLRTGTMPALGDPLSEDEINLIAEWIRAGAPNN